MNTDKLCTRVVDMLEDPRFDIHDIRLILNSIIELHERLARLEDADLDKSLREKKK